MKTICQFDKKKDLGLVIKGLAVDINKMLDTGVIQDSSAQVVYNEIQDIQSVGIRINDDFDAIMLARALKASGLTSNIGTGSSQAAGSTAPVNPSDE